MPVLIETASETEAVKGWLFVINVIDEFGVARQFAMTLSWADYNLWSRSGVDRPAAVAEAVVRFLLSRSNVSSLRDSFDASLARRLHPDADKAVPPLIHDHP